MQNCSFVFGIFEEISLLFDPEHSHELMFDQTPFLITLDSNDTSKTNIVSMDFPYLRLTKNTKIKITTKTAFHIKNPAFIILNITMRMCKLIIMLFG